MITGNNRPINQLIECNNAALIAAANNHPTMIIISVSFHAPSKGVIRDDNDTEKRSMDTIRFNGRSYVLNRLINFCPSYSTSSHFTLFKVRVRLQPVVR